MISLAVLAADWVVVLSPGDYAILKFPPLSRHSLTEQKQAQKALRESEERFRTLIDNMPAGITLKDSEGRLLLTNRMFEEWYDLPREYLLGKRIEEVRPDIVHDPTHSAERAVVAGQKRVQVEQEVDFADGSIHHVLYTAFPVRSDDGSEVNVATIGIDLTEQNNTERLLVESEERFRALVDNLPAGVTLKDRDQNIVFVNGRIEEWYGVGSEEFLGKKFHDVVKSHHNESSAQAQRAVFESGEPVETELSAIFKDGSEHLLQTIFFPVKSDPGEHINVGMLNFDITDRKRTEEMLFQAQKMQAVGQLTGSIAHDFNNLLSVVIGNLEMVAELLQADTPDFYYIRNAFTAAERGAPLTHHLLAFARQQVLQPEETDLERLIFETKELMAISMGEKIAVELHAGVNLRRCKVDQAQLQNAILNLSINARDAMPVGGHLTIRVDNTAIDTDTGAEQELEAGEYVCLSVGDTGSGIPRDVLERVYEPFFTTKEGGVGSGLGLSMVHGFARQSGGGVDIETAEGVGTTVKLYFPAIVPVISSVVGSDRISVCSAPGSLDTSLSHAAGLIEIAACHA